MNVNQETATVNNCTKNNRMMQVGENQVIIKTCGKCDIFDPTRIAEWYTGINCTIANAVQKLKESELLESDEAAAQALFDRSVKAYESEKHQNGGFFLWHVVCSFLLGIIIYGLILAISGGCGAKKS